MEDTLSSEDASSVEDAPITKNASTMRLPDYQLPDYLTNCKIYNPLSDVNVTVDGLVLQVLYGSETGTAQDVAEQIWKSAQRFYFYSPFWQFKAHES